MPDLFLSKVIVFMTCEQEYMNKHPTFKGFSSGPGFCLVTFGLTYLLNFSIRAFFIEHPELRPHDLSYLCSPNVRDFNGATIISISYGVYWNSWRSVRSRSRSAGLVISQGPMN